MAESDLEQTIQALNAFETQIREKNVATALSLLGHPQYERYKLPLSLQVVGLITKEYADAMHALDDKKGAEVDLVRTHYDDLLKYAKSLSK